MGGCRVERGRVVDEEGRVERGRVVDEEGRVERGRMVDEEGRVERGQGERSWGWTISPERGQVDHEREQLT